MLGSGEFGRQNNNAFQMNDEREKEYEDENQQKI